MVNLFKSSDTVEDREAIWRSHGWGPPWKFPATRAGGTPLVLSLRVPVAWKAMDVMKMPAEVASTNGSLAQAVATLAHGIEAAGVVAIMGIGHELPREGKPDAQLFVLLSIALKDAHGPLPDAIPGADLEPVEFKHEAGNYRGVRIRRVTDAAVLPEHPPQPVLSTQYLLKTRHGVLACTFTTPQVVVFEKLSPLLDKIAAGCHLDG